MGEDIFKIVSFDCDLAGRTRRPRGGSQFDDYIDDMIAQRRSCLTHDLFELIRIEDAGDRLNAAELRMLAFSILVAGTDTTRSQLAASMQVLCDHPDSGHFFASSPRWRCEPSKRRCGIHRRCAAPCAAPSTT